MKWYDTASNSYNATAAAEACFTPGSPEAQQEKYIPTATTKEQMFIHFIYNKKEQEFLSDGLAWEDLYNAGILYGRMIYILINREKHICRIHTAREQ